MVVQVNTPKTMSKAGLRAEHETVGEAPFVLVLSQGYKMCNILKKIVTSPDHYGK